MQGFLPEGIELLTVYVGIHEYGHRVFPGFARWMGIADYQTRSIVAEDPLKDLTARLSC